MVQHEVKEYGRKEKMKAALENREKYHQKRKGRNSKRVKDSEHATGNVNLVQNDNLSNQQIRDSRDDKLSHKPATVNRDNCHQLGTLGIRNKYGFFTHSRPVKPNGKIKGKQRGNYETGAKCKWGLDKLSLKQNTQSETGKSLIQTKNNRFLVIRQARPSPENNIP